MDRVSDDEPAARPPSPQLGTGGRLSQLLRVQDTQHLKRRNDERRSAEVPGVLVGALGRMAVTLLNVSATGALLRLEDKALRALEQQRRDGEYLELLTAHATSGLTLVVEPAGLKAAVVLVRWTSDAGPGGPYGVGVAFDPALSAEQVRALVSLRRR